ncbi:hypothetical protein ACFY0B_18075 [Streptomyces sp. NPDC001797]|uniref:hypothetical protein n=1 Tax=Streptomyces sp. NPDC001797 TaxID=3364610 RepID=UPI00368AC478
MTQAEPTPPAGRPDPLSAHRPPPSYQAPGLIPPGGPARTWGLVVIATPLLLAVLIALIGGLAGGSSGSSSGASGAGYDSGLFGSGTSGADTSGSGTSGSDGGGTAGTDDQPAYTDPTTASAWPYGDTTTPGANTTDGYYGDPTNTATAPSASPTAPGDVVTAYFAAISSHDYETAWALGGKNLDSSYDSFVSGYATTEQDTVTVESVAGDQVQVTLEALQTDGTTKSYDATYTVRDGVITSGTATQTG